MASAADAVVAEVREMMAGTTFTVQHRLGGGAYGQVCRPPCGALALTAPGAS
jgi:hypothetical protein